MSNSKMLIDVGSTYFKVATQEGISHHFRNFDKNIYDDLVLKCGDQLKECPKERYPNM